MASATPRAASVTEVDIHVGKILRAIRKAKGLSQHQLADALGVTFQQVQKYENGFNRVSASKMFEAAAFLGVAPATFFDGLPGAPGAAMPAHLAEFIALSDASELAANYLKLTPAKRRVIASMVATMAD